jgi:hypothetical protein
MPPITAIDIALEPDQTMIGHAARLTQSCWPASPPASRWTQRITRTCRFSQALTDRQFA